MRTSLIAPDSSHWAKWLDAMHAPDQERRQRAIDLHARLIDRDRVPFLSWHHLEEMMGVASDATAQARIHDLQAISLISWFRMPGERAGLGSVAQVLAAEAIAASEGHADLISIRDRAKDLILRTGNGRNAIGHENWVWEAVRPLLRARRGSTDMVAALGSFRSFDETKKVGEICRTSSLRSPDEIRAKAVEIREQVHQQALHATGDPARAVEMAEEFMERMLATLPPPDMTVRELIVTSLGSQGVDAHEVRDDCVLGDLSRLGLFRSQLRAVASDTGRSFEELKQVRMDILPSRLIEHVLRLHGQPRDRQPGSDVHDRHLAVLAAYCDVLYVDKRTAEDFRRAMHKEPRLKGLVGEIAKAADFDALLGRS